MRPPELLSQFVREGLVAGHPPGDLRAALERAGWSRAEIDAAMHGWSDAGLGVPVPHPRPSVTGRDAVLYGLMFVALLAVTWHLVQLLFALITIWFPDPAEVARPRGATASMRWSIATLIVLLPLYVWLDRRAEKEASADPGIRRSVTRRKFASITLFLAALALLGDTIAVVYAALSGDLTVQFVAKASVVAVVAALVIAYFRRFLLDDEDA